MSPPPFKREDEDVFPAPPSVSAELKDIKEVVRDIHIAIVGNPELGQRGIIPRLSTAEKKLDEHDRKFLRWGTIIGAAGICFIFVKDALIAFLGLK